MNNPSAFPCEIVETDAQWQARMMGLRQAYGSNSTLSPHGSSQREKYIHPGMTLRDYFAAKAMVALNTGATCHDVLTSLDYVAESAYKMADAMLKARDA